MELPTTATTTNLPSTLVLPSKDAKGPQITKLPPPPSAPPTISTSSNNNNSKLTIEPAPAPTNPLPKLPPSSPEITTSSNPPPEDTSDDETAPLLTEAPGEDPKKPGENPKKSDEKDPITPPPNAKASSTGIEKTPKELTTTPKSTRDWRFIAAVAGGVFFGIIAIFGVLCAMKSFPPEFLGGMVGCCCVAGATGIPAIILGIYAFYRWKYPPKTNP